MASLARSSVLAIAMLPATAIAEPPQPPPDTGPGAAQPVPGDESGRIDTGEGDTTARQVLRGIMFVPKTILEVVVLPVEGTVWAYDRYQLNDRYYDTFYNHDRTFGIVPTAAFMTGFGLSVGAQLISTDTFGEQERLTVSGTWGGTYRVFTDAWLDSGMRFRPFKIQIGGNFLRRPDDPFFGIGNQTEEQIPRPDMLQNPRTDLSAFETAYRYQEARAQVSVGMDIIDGLSAWVRGTFVDLKYNNPTTGTPVEMVYDPVLVTSFLTGNQHVYGEGELHYDSRRRVSMWEAPHLYTTGSLADAFGGYAHTIDGQGGNYWHYGLDLQQFFRFASGPRTLALRLYIEGVQGDYADIPFTDLPYLGGDFLRGYEFLRFRDRIATYASVQYGWDLSRYVNAFVFSDVGRVNSSWEDFSFSSMRAGFGLGLQFHTLDSFLAEGYLATSINGGVVISAAFTPIFDQRPRWR
jgi:hypothetical protein